MPRSSKRVTCPEPVEPARHGERLLGFLVRLANAGRAGMDAADPNRHHGRRAATRACRVQLVLQSAPGTRFRAPSARDSRRFRYCCDELARARWHRVDRAPIQRHCASPRSWRAVAFRCRNRSAPPALHAVDRAHVRTGALAGSARSRCAGRRRGFRRARSARAPGGRRPPHARAPARSRTRQRRARPAPAPQVSQSGCR